METDEITYPEEAAETFKQMLEMLYHACQLQEMQDRRETMFPNVVKPLPTEANDITLENAHDLAQFYLSYQSAASKLAHILGIFQGDKHFYTLINLVSGHMTDTQEEIREVGNNCMLVWHRALERATEQAEPIQGGIQLGYWYEQGGLANKDFADWPSFKLAITPFFEEGTGCFSQLKSGWQCIDKANPLYIGKCIYNIYIQYT